MHLNMTSAKSFSMNDTHTPGQQHDQRLFTRVLLSRTARLIKDGHSWTEGKVHDLCLAGMFVEGQYDLDPGAECTVELHETGHRSSLILHIRARVTRKESHGVALEFLDMPDDSYAFLQTMVLYSADDPFGVALEFLEDFHEVREALRHRSEKAGHCH